MKGILLTLVGGVFCLGMCFVGAQSLGHLSGAGGNKVVDGWRFSGTQKWDGRYLGYTKEETRYLGKDWRTRFVLPEPPANSSERTRAELEYLKGLISERKAHKGAIVGEVVTQNFRWGKYTYGELIDGKKFKHTSRLILATYKDLGVVCFVFKQKFDRVRPSVLAGKVGMKLGTVVEIPGHPAYPSGHATGAFTLAYILQELDPENGEVYRADALRIARNREIGGLHYPSDTEAGRLLGRQIADSLMEDESYRVMLEAARSEW
ncbi:MAG: phosphatase PAP2 family protein [Akkermansiaceae bacterium]